MYPRELIESRAVTASPRPIPQPSQDSAVLAGLSVIASPRPIPHPSRDPRRPLRDSLPTPLSLVASRPGHQAHKGFPSTFCPLKKIKKNKVKMGEEMGRPKTTTNRRTKAESQQIVVTRLLYCLQYPVHTLSSAEDLSFPRSEMTRRRLTPPPFRDEAHASWYDIRPKPIRIHLNRGRVTSSRSSTDSGLEAFSHNPTDVSVAPLAVQLGAKTNDLKQRFLSY